MDIKNKNTGKVSIGPLMLLVTPVLFLLSQVNMSAMKQLL